MSLPATNHALGTPARLGSQSSSADDQARWFKEEVQPHEPALRAWLRGNHPGLHDLDDVIQESYLRLIRARASGQIANSRTYLFGIARHVAIEAHRKLRIFSDVPVGDLRISSASEPDSNVVAIVTHSQEIALAIEAIKTLPDRCREIVTLHSIQGLTYQEIAGRLGLAEETVRVQMARGVKKCAHYLRSRGLTERGAE